MVLTLASLGAFSMGARAATAPPSAKAVTYTWSGKDAGAGVSTDWSDAKNWKGGKAPADGSTVNLVFPVLTCSDTPPCAASSDNDLTGLTIAKWTIDIGQGAVEPSPGQYEISGNGVTVEELTVNSETPTAGDIGNLATIDAPITVTRNQTWTVNVTGNSQPEFQAISGAGNLTVSIGDPSTSNGTGFVDFDGAVTVGTLDLVGADSAEPAFENGTFAAYGTLNANGHAVNVTDAGLFASQPGTIGPLTASGADVQIGEDNGPYGIHAVDGGLALNSTSVLDIDVLTPGTGKQPVAGTTYPQVAPSGSASLGGATLNLTADCGQKVGAAYTFMKAKGGLKGTFAGLANGATVQAEKAFDASCTASGAVAPYLKLKYDDSAGTVTATVVKAPAAPAATAHTTSASAWRTMRGGVSELVRR
jgi:hypothetical protein